MRLRLLSKYKKAYTCSEFNFRIFCCIAGIQVDNFYWEKYVTQLWRWFLDIFCLWFWVNLWYLRWGNGGRRKQVPATIFFVIFEILDKVMTGNISGLEIIGSALGIDHNFWFIFMINFKCIDNEPLIIIRIIIFYLILFHVC